MHLSSSVLMDVLTIIMKFFIVCQVSKSKIQESTSIINSLFFLQFSRDTVRGLSFIYPGKHQFRGKWSVFGCLFCQSLSEEDGCCWPRIASLLWDVSEPGRILISVRLATKETLQAIIAYFPRHLMLSRYQYGSSWSIKLLLDKTQVREFFQTNPEFLCMAGYLLELRVNLTMEQRFLQARVYGQFDWNFDHGIQRLEHGNPICIFCHNNQNLGIHPMPGSLPNADKAWEIHFKFHNLTHKKIYSLLETDDFDDEPEYPSEATCGNGP